MNYSVDPYDEIQSHILGVIVSLMTSYNLNPAHVKERYEYILSLDHSQISHDYQSHLPEDNSGSDQISSDDYQSISSNDQEMNELESVAPDPSWEDMSNNEEEKKEQSPIYVSTRREFCNTMQKGIKICPRYSTCNDNHCNNFHVKSEFICPHVTKGSYCHVDNCELIVIRACHKGKKCNDSECSFRHR